MKALWKRLGGLHGMLGMTIYRGGNIIFYKVRAPILRQFLWVLYRAIDMIIVRMLLGASIPAQCRIGKGLILPHGVAGIFINDNAVIGDSVTIFHQVTIGVNFGSTKAPIIKNGVIIGAGAKIIGDITVNEYAKIGANSVVLKDVPSHRTAVGMPAKIMEP